MEQDGKRLKSVLYLRLKKTEKNDKEKIISKSPTMSKIVKGGLFGLFENPVFFAKYQKIEGGPFGDIKKVEEKTKKGHIEQSHGDEKCSRGALGFFNIPSVAKYQKMKGGPFEDKIKIRKKVAQCRKKSKGGLFQPPPDLAIGVGGFMIVSKKGPISVMIVV